MVGSRAQPREASETRVISEEISPTIMFSRTKLRRKTSRSVMGSLSALWEVRSTYSMSLPGMAASSAAELRPEMRLTCTWLPALIQGRGEQKGGL